MNKKNILVIIQARTDSHRFPKKVLKKIEKKPLLWHVISRVKKMKDVKIIVATSKRKMDDEIVEIANNLNVKTFRGSINNVLDRYYQAATIYKGDIIVRITADCPIIDPIISSKILKKFLQGKYDYVRTDPESFPKGVDTEVFSYSVLKKVWKDAKTKFEKEHVTPYIYQNPKKFKIFVVKNKVKKGKMRLVVDYKEDLTLIRKIFANLYSSKKIFHIEDIEKLFLKNPELTTINRKHIE